MPGSQTPKLWMQNLGSEVIVPCPFWGDLLMARVLSGWHVTRPDSVKQQRCIMCGMQPSWLYAWNLSVGCVLLQHLHEVLTAAEAGRESDINNSMENIMPRVKLIDASLKVASFVNACLACLLTPNFISCGVCNAQKLLECLPGWSELAHLQVVMLSSLQHATLAKLLLHARHHQQELSYQTVDVNFCCHPQSNHATMLANLHTWMKG